MLVPREIYCVQCGYNLARLPPGDCPECGKAFDPEDLRTINRVRRNQNPIARLAYQAVIWISIVSMVGMVVLFMIVELIWPFITWLKNR